MNQKQVCQECGSRMFGRSDKKFCSDLCRNSYHNRLNSEQNSFMRQINGTLKRNRKILEDLFARHTEPLNRNELQELGFNFRHYTGSERTDKGVRYFCYEFVYSYLSKNEIKLSKMDVD
ncbi:MAG: hypothetical protein EP332_13495 [Bacteroidetes bacterium]|nr:MAG: hypothetical protein EP332_13495 [Bacteroidota bacterium]